MSASRGAVFLDVDPTILERNMRVTQDDPMEEELKNLFSSVQAEQSKLVKPTPGFCVKTYTKPDNKKVFVNICITDAIPCPKDITSEELMDILSSEDPSSYRVPMSLGEGRTEHDKKSIPATVYDVAINSKFFEKIEKNELFQTFFLTVVFEGLQDKYQFEIDMQNYLILKNRKSMGTLQSHRIQIRDAQNVEKKLKSPLIEEITEKTNLSKPKITNGTAAPKLKEKEFVYRLRQDSLSAENPLLIAEFIVPNHIKINDLQLEVGEDRVTLESAGAEKTIDFFLPCSIDQNRIIAQLNRNNEILTVKMPTIK